MVIVLIHCLQKHYYIIEILQLLFQIMIIYASTMVYTLHSLTEVPNINYGLPDWKIWCILAKNLVDHWFIIFWLNVSLSIYCYCLEKQATDQPEEFRSTETPFTLVCHVQLKRKYLCQCNGMISATWCSFVLLGDTLRKFSVLWMNRREKTI